MGVAASLETPGRGLSGGASSCLLGDVSAAINSDGFQFRTELQWIQAPERLDSCHSVEPIYAVAELLRSLSIISPGAENNAISTDSICRISDSRYRISNRKHYFSTGICEFAKHETNLIGYHRRPGSVRIALEFKRENKPDFARSNSTATSTISTWPA